MYRCVRTHGFTSDWFPVKQGTRQGGCLSPYLYLVFDNDLLDDLNKCAYCFMMDGLLCRFPPYAVDMLPLSLLKHGMDIMMNICFKNSILKDTSTTTLKRMLWLRMSLSSSIKNVQERGPWEKTLSWKLSLTPILE